MHFHCELLILILTLTLNGQVHAGKINGGVVAEAHSKPYMVLVERTMASGKITNCGGFLLRDDFVMTAAHCHASSYKVLLGVHDYYDQQNVETISVEKTFSHKDYDNRDFKHDLMLLKLRSKATFNSNVKAITLAGQEDTSPNTCTICGWGWHDKKDEMSHVLREVNVTILPDNSCKKDNSYCSEGVKGPGKGDSGGPLVCGDGDGKAYGVVSAAYVEIPGGAKVYHFAKIPDYRDWIDSTMKNN